MKKTLKRFDPNNWDWYAFLRADPRTKKKYEDQSWKKAGEWTTCACGQLCDALPRTQLGEPLDAELSTLGFSFYSRIIYKDWDSAKKTLDLIETRSTKLLLELKT